MTKCYQHDHEGYFVCETDDCGGWLPAGAVYEAPKLMGGFAQRWNGTKWEQVESHKGEEGYVNGLPHTIKSHGPLPEGWSETPPPPTLQEVHAEVAGAINAAFEAAIAPLLAGEPPSAAATYSEQRSEAEAYATDNTAPTLMLDCLAAGRRIDKEELVQRVLVKSTLYKQASGLLLGQQQALGDDVAAIMAADLPDALKIVALEQLDITIALPALPAMPGAE